MAFKISTDKLIVLGSGALVLAVVLAVPLFPPAVGQVKGTGPATPIPANVGEFRGIWLQLHRRGDDLPYEQYIRQIHATGANTLCLNLAGSIENGSSSCIFIDQRKVPGPERLGAMIRLGKKLGMRVVLMPIILPEKPRADEWRGSIKPDDWNYWWQQYDDFISFYAKIAQRNGVDLFMVGSELLTTENDTDRWLSLIQHVRDISHQILDEQFRQYLHDTYGPTDADLRKALGVADLSKVSFSQDRGASLAGAMKRAYDAFAANHHPMLLSYSANWDHYEVPQFWHALDVVGMTSYYNVNPSKKVNPSVADLKVQWDKIRDKIAAWQRKVGKPIVFTEVGWPSLQGCSEEPWNYYLQTPRDDVEQNRCMESFLQTFANQPWVAGILIWKWRDYPGAENDRDGRNYVPVGKPVLKTIEQFFAEPPRGQPAKTAATRSAEPQANRDRRDSRADSE